MQNIPIGNNPYGVVMAYVFKHGRNDILQLFRKHNIPADPTPAEVIKYIKLRGIKFLYDFDQTIIKPYSRMLLEEISQGFDGQTASVATAATSLSSNQKNPNRGENILAGLSGAVSVLGTVLGTIGTIKNNNNPTVSTLPNTATNPINPNAQIVSRKTDDDQADKKYIYIAGGILAAVALLFLIVHTTKK